MAYADYDDQFEALKERFFREKSLSKMNRTAVEQHLNFMRAKGSHTRTLIKHLYCLKHYIHALGGGVDMKKAGRNQIESAVAEIEGTKLGHETKRDIRAIIKAFYKHALGEDLYYPKQVAWIKTAQRKSRKMLPEDILSEGEVIKMLEAAKNPRDKAIIALLFDSGIRMGELMGLRIKDVELHNEPAHITVNGKTGMRKVPLMFSVPYLANYLNANKKRDRMEPLWLDIGSWSNKNKVPDYAAIRKRLQDVGKAAGINKRIYPHLFRHSRATFYANRLTEQQLKVFFGWTGDSKMASTYVHISGRDLDNSILKAYGKTTPETDTKPQLTARKCGRCKRENELDAVYCSGCGAALEVSTAMKGEEHEASLREKAKEALKDPKVIEELVHFYLEQQKEKANK